jgi:hypothetical protein
MGNRVDAPFRSMASSFPQSSAMRRPRSPSPSTNTRGKKVPMRQPPRWTKRSVPAALTLAIRWHEVLEASDQRAAIAN